MTKVIEATGDGACLFNAVAIGLGIEILSGRLDGYKNTPGYQRLLDVFAEHHPHFKPGSWENLKQWLLYYHNSRDWELVLSPVLFKLNQQYQPQLEKELTDELANFIRDNKAGIEAGFEPYQLDFGKCPKIDNLHYLMKRELISRMLPLIRNWDPTLDFSGFRKLVTTEATEQLQFLINLVNNDPNAFQRGYGCHDLKGMADVLSLTLIENAHDNPLDTHPKIYLQNEEQHWNVYCSDADFDQFLHFGPQRLEMTSHEAFRGERQVPSPTQDHPQADISVSVPLIISFSDLTLENPAPDLIQNASESPNRDSQEHFLTNEETALDSQCASPVENDVSAPDDSGYVEPGIEIQGRSNSAVTLENPVPDPIPNAPESPNRDSQEHFLTNEETAPDSQCARSVVIDGCARNYSGYVEPGIQNRVRSKRFFGEHHVYPARWRGEVPSEYESTRHASGDALKSRILDLLESRIASMSAQELLALINEIRNPDSASAERKAWEVLATGQGLITRAFGATTTSIKTFNQMVSHYGQKVGLKREDIDAQSNPRLATRHRNS